MRNLFKTKASETKEVTSNSMQSINGLKILIAEDDETSKELFSIILDKVKKEIVFLT